MKLHGGSLGTPTGVAIVALQSNCLWSFQSWLISPASIGTYNGTYDKTGFVSFSVQS